MSALLEAVELHRRYRARGLAAATRPWVRAVDGVSLSIAPGQAFGLVGESGSGKSTLARLLLALEPPDSGTVTLAGHLLSSMGPGQIRPLRRRFQAVFQDPLTSLNPRLRVATIVAEPLIAHGLGKRAERAERVRSLLALVGLRADAARRLPTAFSGGEAQRIAIARAIAPEPDLLILDEPVSSLDAHVRGQILGLLGDLRQRLGLTLLFISHDLAVVRQLCDTVGVMLRGVLLEHGPTAMVLSAPAHPYTRDLLAATPVPDAAWRPPQPVVRTQSAQWPEDGCRYRDRCPHFSPRCHDRPGLRAIAAGHYVACWLAGASDMLDKVSESPGETGPGEPSYEL